MHNLNYNIKGSMPKVKFYDDDIGDSNDDAMYQFTLI